MPGTWHELDVDLSRWAGQPVALGLVTGSAGPFNYDWTAWGEPKLVEAGKGERLSWRGLGLRTWQL